MPLAALTHWHINARFVVGQVVIEELAKVLA
jgi:hypothetical protein